MTITKNICILGFGLTQTLLKTQRHLGSACFLSSLHKQLSNYVSNYAHIDLPNSVITRIEESHSVSWIDQYKDFCFHLNTNGVQNIADKLLPIKKRKPRASGATSIHFLDFMNLRVTAGNGGDGEIHFMKVFCNPNAGPSGGDGGNGGHVIFKASKNLKSLSPLGKIITAESGQKGGINNCHGKCAPDLIIEVPVGTIFKSKGTCVADLEDEGDMFIAARGGAGGKGNSFFTNSIDQAPMVAEYGGEGEKFYYQLELKVMADIGLIGIPNAGKSTLLRSISRARPKVAAYPFTTLNPHVGMVEYGDYHQLAVADLPGLVEGSHSNEGLGMEFLKHVQRCSSLLFVLDASEKKPLDQLAILNLLPGPIDVEGWSLEKLSCHKEMNELEHYEKGLAERPHAIVLNKMDLPKAQENFPVIQAEVNLPVFPISAKHGRNLLHLLAAMRLLSETKKIDK